ncbi:C-terminal binding protein [Haloarcula laminariae]|uniref:C-terminal binding protein n=1 Tax=Haloarcula laminariae TaxID=2961577 RepID=UPI0021C9FB60|nr:C-terminal binding protein [Halomicroarcula laminariae]
MTDTVRAVMLDPDWFGDVDAERRHFRELLDREVTVEGIDCTEAEIPGAVGEADLLLSHYTGVSAAAMDATGCSVVSRYATGIDDIDVPAATERGVRVTRVPSYCDDEVGSHIVSLAMALVRGLPMYDAATESGAWQWKDAAPIRPPEQLTFGFLAFGNKARAAAERAAALGFDVCAHDPFLDDEEITSRGATPVGFEELLDESDVLSVNTPLTPDTEGMLDADALARLDDDAVVVNTSRGKVIDEDALLAALEADELRGAGLDVLAEEPPASGNPLLARDDVIVTPHAAWYSTESEATLRRRGTEIAVAAYNGEHVDGVVNPDALE